MFEEIELFGTTVKIKNYFCSANPNQYEKKDIKLNFYIKITDACNAKCLFCSNKEMQDDGHIDFDKLEYVLQYLHAKNLINRISITGGEPLLNIDTLNKVINLIYEVIPASLVTLNTNGYNIRRVLELDNINRLEGIHISRHHYDDVINHQIFKVDVALTEDIKFVMDKLENKHLLRLNCLLANNYINNIDQVQKYLEYASQLNIFRVGFVSLMPINDYSKKHFISFNEVFSNLPSTFLSSGHYYDHQICECINGVYIAKNGNLIEYYSRMTKELNCDYARQLVYTSSNKLTTGFGKDSLI